ncbi:MAG TPA: MFS transporter [Paracoccaceae bacterium]|nr:MFS transporter [Paracoccaceae bacterium]
MPGKLWVAVLPLAVAETLVWAAFYYSFPALLPAWEADLGWSRTELAGAFTGAMVLTGLLAPRAGRVIDRGAGSAMFLGAIAAGALLLAALAAVAELWQFWVIWLALGVVNAFCLYEATFAIITTTMGTAARRAITQVTLVAGFAGTVSFPAAWGLSETIGWRGALLVFAGVILVVALPLAWLGLRLLAHHAEDPATKPQATGREGRAALRNPAFWLIGFGFAVVGLTHGMIITHIRPIMDSRGVAEGLGVAVASLVGPMQVLGRVIMVSVQNRVDIHGVAAACYIGMAAGAAALLFATGSPVLAVGFVIPYAAAYGVISIVRPVLTAELLGRAGFGTISGMVAMPYMLGMAAAPSIAALLWQAAGYDVVIAFGIAMLMAGLAAVRLARRSAGAG